MCSTGLGNEFHLWTAEESKLDFDPATFNTKGRMPSMFFCAAPPKEREDRERVLRFVSPRSRLLSGDDL